MKKSKADILLRVNYTANNRLDANEKLNQLTNELASLVKIKCCNQPSLYWKDKSQYQVLYILCGTDNPDAFIRLRDNISKNWDISKNNEAIWNGMKDKHSFFLHPTVKWAHLEFVAHE